MPAKKPTNASEARRTNVLLEELRSEFRSFGDGLKGVREKLDSTFVELRLSTLEGKAGTLLSDSATIKKDLDILKTDLKSFAQRLESAEAKLPA